MNEELKNKLTERFNSAYGEEVKIGLRDALRKVYLDGVEHGYQYAVDKACEWLKTNAYDYTRLEYLPESDYPQADVDVCKMVKDLRKAMEE